MRLQCFWLLENARKSGTRLVYTLFCVPTNKNIKNPQAYFFSSYKLALGSINSDGNRTNSRRSKIIYD